MSKKILIYFIKAFLVFYLLWFQNQNLIAARKIKIVTSIFPLMEFAEAICGERGEVRLLLPPGAEVHTWKPRPTDIIRLSSADLFIYISSDLEPWIHNILKSIKNPNLKILEAGQGLSLIEEDSPVHHRGPEHEVSDPHIWLDFENDRMIIDKIAALLSEISSEGSTVFKKNAAVYKEKLRRLDQNFNKALQDCVHRTFILGGHAAFGYLARKYNLHQISLYGLNPSSKPTIKQLIKVVELAQKYKIKIIFFETQVSDKLAEVIAKEVGAKTLVLNPGASLTKEQLKSGLTFFDIMEKNLENLKDGLGCK